MRERLNSEIVEFRLSKCVLRPWQAGDAESLALHANNPDIACNLRDGFPYPYTPEHARQWLQNSMKDEKNFLFAIDIDGKAVGGIGIIPGNDVYRLSAEIGYWLSEAYWNHGIMTEAVQTLVRWTFKNMPIIRIYAGIFEKNKISMRVLEKAGFRQEAIHRKAVIKNDVIMDEIIYAILR